MDRNRWIIFGVICIAILGFLVFNRKQDEVKVDNIDPAKVITDNKPLPDHTYGSDSKKVVLIEYGDFQCPGCGSLFPKLKPLKEHYKEQLTFVFRNFPLTSMHPNALAAATAAEAAGLQGKWWEYHDKLYENQTAWSQLDSSERGGVFESYAKEIGLNVDQFKKDIKSDKIAQKIKRDQSLGKKSKATATPTLVLNGKTLPQNQWSTAEDLENIIREAIEKSGQTPPERMDSAQNQ